MTAWIKIHFPRCKQTEVFVSPLERALACEGSSEGKSCKTPPRKPKGFYSKLSRKTFHGKQNSGTRRWFVFFACWLKKYSQKCHSTFFPPFLFLKTTNKQKIYIRSYLTFFLMAVTRTLNKNDQCISFCFHFKDTKGCYLQITFIQTDNISVAQQSPQMKMHSYLQNRTLGTGRVWLENSSQLCMNISFLFKLKDS